MWDKPNGSYLFVDVATSKKPLIYCPELAAVLGGGYFVRPYIYEGHPVGFEVYDPTGRTIRNTGKLFEMLHARFPQVTRRQVEHALIGYDEYYCAMVLWSGR
ncbi:hypothetical protein ES708_19936 [subsurface metagenome]